VMESDAFRRSFLRFVAGERGLDWTPGKASFAAAREAQLDRLGDLISENVDRNALLRLIDDGQPQGLPVVAGQLVSRSASQQTAVGDAPGEKASPSMNGEMWSPIPPAFAVPGGDEQRSES
jgi:adenosylcobyric acid synthase